MKKCEIKKKKKRIYIDYAGEYLNIFTDTYFKVYFISSKDFMQNLAKLFKTETLLQFKSSKYLCTLGSLK